MEPIIFNTGMLITGAVGGFIGKSWLIARALKLEAKAKADAMAIQKAVAGVFTKAKAAGATTLDEALEFLKKEAEKI